MKTGLLGAALVACVAAYGVHLVYTAVSLRWSGVGPGPRLRRPRRSMRVRVDATTVRACSVGLLAAMGAAVIFTAAIPAFVAGALGAAIAATTSRAHGERRQERIAAAWPPLLEELRVLTGAAGRPIPHALFQAGTHGPDEIRSGIAAAQHEWHTSTDFERSLVVLKRELAEPSTDMICETLLVAHQVGGSGVDRRLESLIDDRSRDLDLRREAASRQAGARFARRFVLIVPIGMALVGLSLGTGRAAYRGPTAQIIVGVAIALVAACWTWAGQILRVPRPERVFS